MQEEDRRANGLTDERADGQTNGGRSSKFLAYCNSLVHVGGGGEEGNELGLAVSIEYMVGGIGSECQCHTVTLTEWKIYVFQLHFRTVFELSRP